MSLSDRDLDLAKKHALPFTIDSRVLTVIGFSPTNLAAFLAERDALAIKEKDDAVRELMMEAALRVASSIYTNAEVRKIVDEVLNERKSV